MRTLLVVIGIIAGNAAYGGEWKRLASLPDEEGFAGPFAGVSHGSVIVAGGANFPGRKPWEGGTKLWYDKVFVLERPDGEWKIAGKLPRPLGYGVSVTQGQSVVCVGGSDATRHYSDAFRLEWKQGELVMTELPPLPKPVANACGALVEETLYVAGGQELPDSKHALSTVWRIDLSAREPRWMEIEACPGNGRMLAVAAGFDGAFWLVGGVDLVAGMNGTVERKYLRDAYRHDPGKGWTRIADLPRPVVGAPSPAPCDPAGFYVLGGDDGEQVGAAPDAHRGFNKNTLRFDLKTGKWDGAGELSDPRVTVPCVVWGISWVVPSGEVRPGVRSKEVWSFTPGNVE